MKKNFYFLDLFAGCGGLSEGFINAGFEPIAHIEMDSAAAYSLKTRMCYHWLKKNKKIDLYIDYLNKKITREELYNSVPKEIINSVINKEIGAETLGDIFNDIDHKIQGKKLEILVGGPPCQAYSLVGRSRDKNRMLNDDRNYLYQYYAEFLKKYKPSYFIFENVTGLLSAKDIEGNKHFDNMLSLFQEIGYCCEYKVLNAKDFGVPQNRKRVIILGNYKTSPKISLDLNFDNANITICDLFSDLPKLKAGQTSGQNYKKLNQINKFLLKNNIRNMDIPLTFHTARPNTNQDLSIYRMAVNKWNKENKRLNYNDLPSNLQSHKNHSSFTDRFKVVAGNIEYSHTVVAHIARDGHYYIHPDIEQNRSLTPREAARLQTFPDDYYFECTKGGETRTSAFKQIGNAVPVLLAKKIALHIKEYLTD